MMACFGRLVAMKPLTDIGRTVRGVASSVLDYAQWVIQVIVVYLVGAFWSFGVCARVVQLIWQKPWKFLSSKKRRRPHCLDDRRFGAHGFAKISHDVQLHYVISGPYEAPYLLLLHGFPEFWYSWRHQITAFNKDYRVVAVDLRGYGESAKPSAVRKYKLDTLVSDVKHLLEYLRVDSCFLVGHDWGGAITWRFCELYPELVKQAVVLNCPHPSVMMNSITHTKEQFLRSWYMFFFAIPWLPEWFFWSGDRQVLDNMFCGKTMGAKTGAFTAEDMECFKYTYSSPGRFSGPMNYIRAALRYTRLRQPAEVDKPLRTDTPILLVWGTRDTALCQEMAELSRSYASDFRLRYIHGASHWVQQDDPQLVNAYIRNFFLDSADKHLTNGNTIKE